MRLFCPSIMLNYWTNWSEIQLNPLRSKRGLWKLFLLTSSLQLAWPLKMANTTLICWRSHGYCEWQCNSVSTETECFVLQNITGSFAFGNKIKIDHIMLIIQQRNGKRLRRVDCSDHDLFFACNKWWHDAIDFRQPLRSLLISWIVNLYCYTTIIIWRPTCIVTF